MRVVCVRNSVKSVPHEAIRVRLSRAIQLPEGDNDLSIGKEYVVQAVERIDSGLWFYIHTVEADEYPFHYPAEFFDVRSNAVPSSWHLTLAVVDGSVFCKRMTFRQWAEDDVFYERLVDLDAETVSIYCSARLR